MNISILIVTRGMTDEVGALATRLRGLLDAEGPSVAGEVLVIAEDSRTGSPSAHEPLQSGAMLVRIPARRGLGYNRNRALDAAGGDVVVFVDDDCWPVDDWLPHLLAPLADPAIDGIMGNVRIRPSSYLGDSISALGFPAGGSAGFAVMFPLDDAGFTTHLSTLNCALRVTVFPRVGSFDESMTSGAEDGEFSYRMAQAGILVKFQTTALVDHAARDNLSEFTRWFFRRGRAACQYSRRVPAAGTIGRRLASYRTILRINSTDPKILAIVPLLGASVLLQQAGFVWELLTGTDMQG